MAAEMFIFVKLSSDDRVVMNPDCASINFWKNVKGLLEGHGIVVNEDANLDLCDMNGTMKDVRGLHPLQSMAQLLNTREVYIPVLVEPQVVDEETQILANLPILTPLLPEGDEDLAKFSAKLKKQQKASMGKHVASGKQPKAVKESKPSRNKNTLQANAQQKTPSSTMSIKGGRK